MLSSRPTWRSTADQSGRDPRFGAGARHPSPRLVSGIIWEVLLPSLRAKEAPVSTPIEITDSTFDEEVLKADKLVLVDFWAPWCGPCRSIGPVLAEIAEEKQDQLKVVKVNIDDHQQHAAKFRVMSIPSMIVFKGGEQVERLDGAMPKRMILSRLEPLLA
jgi:thioredoxin 1